MNIKDAIFLILGFVGLLLLYQAQYLYFNKKISSVANAQGMVIITLANFDENQNAYQGLTDMFGKESKLGGHINSINERKIETQNQFYLFLAIGFLLIGISTWFFYTTYKHPVENRQIHKPTLLLITFLLGSLGFHKFYTGNFKLGFIYFAVYFVLFAFELFAFTGLIALIEFVRYIMMKKDALQAKYEQKSNQPFGFIW